MIGSKRVSRSLWTFSSNSLNLKNHPRLLLFKTWFESHCYSTSSQFITSTPSTSSSDSSIALNHPSLSPVTPTTSPRPSSVMASLQPTIPNQNRSFYQRQLPDSCVSFTSHHGKSLFRSALSSGHLESFFPLASQLVTQHDPSFCGLATLCTVLNALGVDPKRVWKHPWRWYEQDMLDCCRSLESIKTIGITLAEFNCLARCNGLSVTTRSPRPSSSVSVDHEDQDGGINEFRDAVSRTTTSASELMVISFCRSALGQTGTGHFSPIAGYSPEHDRVLVLDVARFKYPSYWVALEELYNSMKPIDLASSKPRGYSILSYSKIMESSINDSNDLDKPIPLSVTTLNLNKSSWAILSQQLKPIIDQSDPHQILLILKSFPIEHLIEFRTGYQSLSAELTEQITKFFQEQLSQSVSISYDSPLQILLSLALCSNQVLDSVSFTPLIEKELKYLRSQLEALSDCCDC